MTTAIPTGPRWTRGTIEYIKDKFVVRNGLMYDYYDISCRPHVKQERYIHIITAPGVLQDGIAMVGKHMYDVSIRDLNRGRIDVSRIRANEQQPESTNITTKSKSKSDSGILIVATSNESGTSESDWDKVSKDADLAWENQVGALLQTLHSKEGEEWEITDLTQSGQVNEGRSVQSLQSHS